MSSLEMFGFCFLYSCNLSYFSVKKVLRCSFWSSDSFSSPPSRFNSLAMLLSSSGVITPLSELHFSWISLIRRPSDSAGRIRDRAGRINNDVEGTPALSPCQLLNHERTTKRRRYGGRAMTLGRDRPHGNQTRR